MLLHIELYGGIVSDTIEGALEPLRLFINYRMFIF